MIRRRFAALIVVLAAVTIGFAQAQTSDPAVVLLEAARQKETLDGDLRAAIEEYRTIATRPGVGREVAATALLRMAECYDKLGDAKARAIYEQVVREFADQREAVAIARSRLSEAGAVPGVTGTTEPSSRTVWSRPTADGIFGGGIVSRDGRLLPYIDWSTGDLVIRDLASGRDRRLTDTASYSSMGRQYVGFSRISPDGRHVAFAWFNGVRYDLRVLDLKSDGISQPRIVYDNADVTYLQPFDWSPDGTRLAVQLTRTDRSGQIALVSVSDGTLAPLKSFPWRDQSTNMFFSPDGRLLGYDLPSDDAPGERDVYVLAVDGSREVRVAPHRRNDEMVGWSSDGKRLLFASDRTGSVQLWTQSMSGLEMDQAARVVPSDFRGQPRGISSAGALYYLATTYEASPFRVTGFDFESNRATETPADPGEEFYSVNQLAQADWSPDGKTLALNRRDRGGPVGMLVSLLPSNGRTTRHVRPQLGLSGGHLLWGRDGASFIAAGTDLKNRPGLFRVDAESGEATPLMYSADGESHTTPALSPDGTTLYYRHVTLPGVRIVARTLATGAERELIRRNRGSSDSPNVLAGLLLSPDGRQVVTSVFDPATKLRAVAVVDVSSGESRELVSRAGVVEPLMWSPDSRSVFIRRRGTDRAPEVLRVQATGGAPVTVEWTLGHDTRDFRVHPGGRQLVFVRSNASDAVGQSEVRMMPGIAR